MTSYRHKQSFIYLKKTFGSTATFHFNSVLLATHLKTFQVVTHVFSHSYSIYWRLMLYFRRERLFSLFHRILFKPQVVVQLRWATTLTISSDEDGKSQVDD